MDASLGLLAGPIVLEDEVSSSPKRSPNIDILTLIYCTITRLQSCSLLLFYPTGIEECNLAVFVAANTLHHNLFQKISKIFSACTISMCHSKNDNNKSLEQPISSTSQQQINILFYLIHIV